jgi:acyl-CoA reductase-like NAD-dependent aldehyde dehydrogenase
MGLAVELADLRSELYIGGGWHGADRDRPVINPATGETIVSVAEGGPTEAGLALAAARAALPQWRARPPVERARILGRIAELVELRLEFLAAIVTLEQGKTIAEARGEVGATAEFFRFFAEFARRIEGEILPSDAPDEHVLILRVPYGVCVGILPWNYPSVICARKAAPALIAGNTVVLEQVVPAAVATRFMNCGQVCTCNERTFVHRDVYEQFLARYTEQVSRLRVGDPFDESTEMGPKVSDAELRKVAAMVERAARDGAEIVTGGRVLSEGAFARGYWYAPTVITNVRPGMEIAEDEIFGPVSPVLPFEDPAALLESLNSSRYGLAAYVFTSDLSEAMRIARDLDFGELYVNRIGPEQPQGFHTGFRESGLGGDDGKHGLDGFMRKKTVYLNYAPRSSAH